MSDNLDNLPQGLDPLLNREAAPPGEVERRKSKRFPITAGAEIVDLRTQARVSGRAADLGLGGCYIDALSPLPVGSTVRITLERNQKKFEAGAIVTYSLLSMGMGLSFTEIKTADESLLQAWISELSGELQQQLKEPTLVAAQMESNMSTIANLRQSVNELINLLVRKKAISEGEAESLLHRIYR